MQRHPNFESMKGRCVSILLCLVLPYSDYPLDSQLPEDSIDLMKDLPIFKLLSLEA
jgi:hypothetical protein